MVGKPHSAIAPDHNPWPNVVTGPGPSYDRNQPERPLSHPPLILVLMKTTQLHLVSNPPSWKLDDQTRDIGRKGLAQARAALQADYKAQSKPVAA